MTTQETKNGNGKIEGNVTGKAVTMMTDLQTVPRGKVYVSDTFNSRETLRDIPELARDIRLNGLLQPLVVRRANPANAKEKGFDFFLIAGFRRMEALKSLGWTDVPVTVVSPKGEKEAMLQNIAENVGRESLSGYELGNAVTYLADTFKMGGAEIAASLSGITKGYINNLLRFSRNVSEPIRHEWHRATRETDSRNPAEGAYGHKCATTDLLAKLASMTVQDPETPENAKAKIPDHIGQYKRWVAECKAQKCSPGFGDGVEDPDGDLPETPDVDADAEAADAGTGSQAGETRNKRPSMVMLDALAAAIAAAEEAGVIDLEGEHIAASFAISCLRFSMGQTPDVKAPGFLFDPIAMREAAAVEKAAASAKAAQEKADAAVKKAIAAQEALRAGKVAAKK